jgi:hypothetical protein
VSRLPEKGEAKRAADAMDRRAELVIGRTNVIEDVGGLEINTRTAEATGDGMDAYRKVFGDLFDLGDTVAVTWDLVAGFIEQLARTEDPQGVLMSLFLQGVGLGVMMERQRWQS